MPKPKWNLNTIYISERLQESLRPISRCAMTTVVAPMGYGKTTAVNWYLAQRTETEDAAVIRISVYSDNLAIFWRSVQEAFDHAGFSALRDYDRPADDAGASLLADGLCRALAGAQLPVHKDYLGSLMGLALKREALGDILLPADAPGTAYVFALEPAAKLICRELCQAGRTEVSTRLLEPEEIPAFPAPERQLLTATVSSLRLDAVLSAMLHVSRGTAAELIEAGREEINHLPVEKPHAPVYEQDVFTVRGKGRFRLTALPGKSKKDRSIIEFFQY